jgi:prevent-host-death family protein
VSVSEVRSQLRAVLDRVKQGDEVVLTQNGQAVAVLVHPARLRARRAGRSWDAATERLDRMRDARRRRPGRGAGLAPGRAEELADEVRRARDER